MLDGITVLSGINGSGKSTLSKMLYYLINGISGFETYLFDEYKSNIIRILERINLVCKDMRLFTMRNRFEENNSLEKLTDIIDKLKEISSCSNEQISLVQDLFQNALFLAMDILSEAMTDERITEMRRKRALSFLNGRPDDNSESVDEALDKFINKNSRYVEQLTTKLIRNINERPVSVFKELVGRIFKARNEFPKSIQLEEDGVPVLEDEHLLNLFSLSHAIYIDTPMAIENRDTDNIFWESLRKLILEDYIRDVFSVKQKKIIFRIKQLLDGETYLDEDEVFDKKSLRYISSDKKVNILLKDAATGFKTFAYLQRLLENGSLGKDILLMIDEPEAHLHPQWIVEFARLLVLLHKELDVKIILASHNPDMVAAIHDIANKEDVLHNTHFYVAESDAQNPHQYVFKDLGHEVGEIFQSFNIALDKISRYGKIDV